jgi:NADPH:quinone reductase-like Zn-dependent oxidoreductase
MLGHITDPSAPGGLARRELPDPEPSGDEVVLDVRAYAVNRGELSLLERRPDGWQPGQDVAGVLADGSGTRVVALADGGGWSERVAVPASRVAPLPDGVSFAAAAALPVAGLTALRTLRQGGSLLGRRVLVTGATGGVGGFAVQLAVAGGAHVTALVSGPPRVEAAQALGPQRVVTALGDDDGPFDVVVDGVGGPLLGDAIRRLAPGGAAVAYGVAGGGEATSLHFYDFAGGPLGRLVGFFIYATEAREPFGPDLATLAGLVADGRLRVPRPVERDWADTVAAVDALRRREATGKVVLTVDGG